MKILNNIEAIDLALYFDSTIVISDIHIGYEEELNKKGILVPRLQFDEIAKRIGHIFNSLKEKNIKRIVINGDLKHSWAISEQEWRNVLKFLDLTAKYCNEIVLVKGNHDLFLGHIARKRNIKIVDYCLIGKVLIIHGDKIPKEDVLKQASTIIIGHEHPAITLKEGPRTETVKCFLKGKYKRKNLIVLPSFNSIIGGTNIMRDEILSPFLKQNLDDFEVFVFEDKIYNFGKLKNLKNKY